MWSLCYIPRFVCILSTCLLLKGWACQTHLPDAPPSPLPLRPVVVAMVTASLWDIKGVFNHGVIASLQQSVTYFGLKIERICLFFTNHLLFFHPCTLWGRQGGVNPNNRTMKACILSGGVAIYTFMIKARPNKETNESWQMRCTYSPSCLSTWMLRQRPAGKASA